MTPTQTNDPRILDDLFAAFRATDNIVLKKYISQLSDAECTPLSEELTSLPIGSNASLYRMTKIIYEKNENIRDKLTTVYATILSLKNCGLTMLVCGHHDHAELYLGVVSRNMNTTREGLIVNEKRLDDDGKTLRNAFFGNFPGTDLQPVPNITVASDDPTLPDLLGKRDLIEQALGNARYIAAVSSIPAIRNSNESKNQEFVQGLEKLIDSLRGKEYTMMILADAMSNQKIEEMCAEYEDIYAQLAPFKTSNQTINTSLASAETESLVKGITDTTNESLAKSLTHGTSLSKTHTDSGGVSIGGSIGNDVIGGSLNINYNHSYSRTKATNDATTNTTTTGTSKSLTEQNSVAKSLTSTNGESVQITYENRSVKTLLDRIDEQIKRMRSCEDFGMFDTCAYFAAQEHDVVVAAAAAFKSLTRGENSSVESSAVNVWRDTNAEIIKDYLMRFYHPEFLTVIDEMVNDDDFISRTTIRATAAMLISGKEMAYQMALPKKSIAGIPVIEYTEFGRETVSLAETKGDIAIGKIFHMHKTEEMPVKLNADNLTAHTFITGSTGAGKSTAIYKLLDALTENKEGHEIKFMVIEPAKGEYKNALAMNPKFHLQVFGTNPRLTKLLRINPFRFPSDTIHIYEHLDRLTEIFNVCWPMYAAMPAVLKAAMENAYRSVGWDLIRSENPRGNIFPSFFDVALEVENYINQSEYSAENKSNYKGSLLTRLESLTNGVNKMIFSSDDLDDSVLFDENAIVDLSRVGSTETKALIMGILILKLQEYRMSQASGENSTLRHITVLEEAHNLLKRTSTEQSSETANLIGKSVEMLANSIAEMRTYGEGFIIADQSPGLLDLSVIRNTNTKILLRLPDFTDRELVGKAAGLNDDQIHELARLPRGVAAVFQNDWLEAVLCKIDKPKLVDGIFKEKEPIPETDNDYFLFELLDTEFRKKLDDVQEEIAFRQRVLRSTLSSLHKRKLLEYLRTKERKTKARILSSVLYESFENPEEAIKSSADAETIDDMKAMIIGELEPSVWTFPEEQLNSLLTLLLIEYNTRHQNDTPIWDEFITSIPKEGLI